VQKVRHAARLALAFALAAASPSASAVDLGEPEVRSAPGEPLDARIPFTIPAGESVDSRCFALVREAAETSGVLDAAILTIERRRGETALRLRTAAPVMETSLTVRVRAACPGREGGMRVYNVALNARPPVQATPPLIDPAPAVVARLGAAPGETLETMAAKVYPREGEARRKYLSGLRVLNPQYAAAGAPIPEGTSIALPDPRTIRTPRAMPRPATQLAADAPATPPAQRAPRPQRAARAPEAPPPATRVAAEKPAPRAREPRPERRIAPGPEFVLKLSSTEVDLSRSRKIDDRMRAQLRERLLFLDADDQVAAMLSMRNSLRQLEARVAEMQLKLDASLAPRTAIAAPKAEVPAPKVEPAPPKVAAPPPPAPKVEVLPPPKVEAPPPPPKVEAPPPPPKVEAPPPKVEAPAAPKVQAPPAPKPMPASPGATKATREEESFALPDWLWAVAAVLALLAAILGWRLMKRRREAAEEDVEEEPAPRAEPVAVVAAPPAAAPGEVSADEPFEVAAEMHPQVSSDSALATRLTENAGELRRRYIEERFPEIQSRSIVLEDPASVVKGARLFYEDGAITRAVELLQFVIEERPGEVRPWLALFEIFRLERLSGEYAQLAERFREHHGKGPQWRKVQYFGREIDPGNPLYREEPLNTLETIGPREAKRLAAGLSSVGATDAFDPVAENWLEAPMDFENEVLANELRLKLMAQASLTEQDLVPNPMPALRNIEMFTVA
jgi:phage tail protein X